jgi:magnesium transporter
MVRKRAAWLLLLFFAAILTTTIIASYEDQLESVAALAVFIPLLIGTGGNAGSQTTTTIIRAMATAEIEFRDGIKVWFKEIRVGLLLGFTMALLALVLAIIMFNNSMLSLTVGIAIFFIILTANFVGAILPLVAKRMGLDPTLLSAPMITTTVDAVGLIIYFSVAKLVIGI